MVHKLSPQLGSVVLGREGVEERLLPPWTPLGQLLLVVVVRYGHGQGCLCRDFRTAYEQGPKPDGHDPPHSPLAVMATPCLVSQTGFLNCGQSPQLGTGTGAVALQAGTSWDRAV